MTVGFTRSPEFVIALLVSILFVGAASAAYAAEWTADPLRIRQACPRASDAGAALPVVPDDTGAVDLGDTVERTITYQWDALGRPAVLVTGCTVVGDITVIPAEGDFVRIEFEVHAHGRGAIEAVTALAVDGRVADIGSGLAIAALQVNRPDYRYSVFDTRSVSVHTTIAVPQGLVGGLRVETDVGDIRLERLLGDSVAARTDVGDVIIANLAVNGTLQISTDVGDVTVDRSASGQLAASTDVGDVKIRGVNASGPVDVHTDVGQIDAHFSGLGPFALTMGTDVGALGLQVPGEPRYGYRIDAGTDVGSISVSLGPMDFEDRSDDGPGETYQGRTRDAERAEVGVVLNLSSDVGVITVVAG